MVHVKSLYPSIPEFPLTNLYDFCLKRRPANEPDYIFHIDSATGAQRSWHEFRARAAHAMTALGAPERDGGLGISREEGEIVGIVSPNALDYVTLFFALWGVYRPCLSNVTCLQGLIIADRSHCTGLPYVQLWNSGRAPAALPRRRNYAPLCRSLSSRYCAPSSPCCRAARGAHLSARGVCSRTPQPGGYDRRCCGAQDHTSAKSACREGHPCLPALLERDERQTESGHGLAYQPLDPTAPGRSRPAGGRCSSDCMCLYITSSAQSCSMLHRLPLNLTP
jgi:hypothetical protein